jgi:hypothetical protein
MPQTSDVRHIAINIWVLVLVAVTIAAVVIAIRRFRR